MALILADLRNRVAQRLRILGEGAELSGADATLIEDAINELHEELLTRGWAQWDLTDIPDHVARPLVTIVAAELAGEFGLPESDRVMLANDRMTAMGRLQALAASNPAPREPTKATYY